MTRRRRAHPAIELLSSETLFAGRIFDLERDRVRLPSGLVQEITFVDHPGAVGVLAECEGGEVLLVRQYRHALGDWLLEIPAGRLERGEEPLAAARRELEEETGYRAREWSELGSFYAAPGFCSERIDLFLARELELAGPGRLQKDRDEEFELVRLAPDAVMRLQPRDAKTWIAAASRSLARPSSATQ